MLVARTGILKFQGRGSGNVCLRTGILVQTRLWWGQTLLAYRNSGENKAVVGPMFACVREFSSSKAVVGAMFGCVRQFWSKQGCDGANVWLRTGILVQTRLWWGQCLLAEMSLTTVFSVWGMTDQSNHAM